MNQRSFASALVRSCQLNAVLFYLCIAGWIRATDADGDGIDASWESTYSGSPAFMSDSDPTDAWEDPDGDLLNNLGESIAATNPGDADSDGDGLNDVYNYGLDSW